LGQQVTPSLHCCEAGQHIVPLQLWFVPQQVLLQTFFVGAQQVLPAQLLSPGQQLVPHTLLVLVSQQVFAPAH